VTRAATFVSVALAEIERVLHRSCGLTPSPGIRRGLGDACLKAARALEMDGPEYLARLFAGEARCVTALVEAAVVSETYFFRHPEQLELIREHLLAPAPRDRPLAVWSAGCATGEEPYSLAMALLDAGRAACGDRILATDVSGRALQVARAARYGSWSLRRLDPAARRRWFEGRGAKLEVRSEVRERVEFLRHNLVREPPPGEGFDLVVCRNVLIYFDPPTAAEVAARLLGAVRPGGFLVLGPVELPFADGIGAERIEGGGATVLQRPGGAPRPRARPAQRAAVRAPRRAARPATPAPLPPPPPAPPQALPERPVLVAPRPIDRVREAAHRGDVAAAERLARDAAMLELCPECWLFLATAAESRGDVPGALDAVRKALYLDPDLAMAHAALVPLYGRLGLDDEAARARRNALRALEGLADGAALRGTEGMTAGALRSALDGPASRRSRSGGETLR